MSVHFEGPPGVSLSICEAFVYTDQALPIGEHYLLLIARR